MQRTSFEQMACPIARTLDVIGEPWTPLVVRDIYVGVSRFDEIQRNLGISRKVLSNRLATLLDHDVIERDAYQGNPPRYDYRLTDKGADLAVVLLAMKQWGDRWSFGGKDQPMLLRHDSCGTITDPVLTCSGCGEHIHPGDTSLVAGPGFSLGPGTREIPAAMARAQLAAK
jgi:DNA-binding HxlR family transcriptional regulator